MTGSNQQLLNQLRVMDEYEFEELVADVWEAQGWNTEVTAGSGDRGIDVIAEKQGLVDEKMLIQAKRYQEGNNVGGRDVREYASLQLQESNIDSVVIVTTSSFTRQAKDIAGNLNVKLVDGTSFAASVAELSDDGLEKYTALRPTKSHKNKTSFSEPVAEPDHPFGNIVNPNQDVKKSNLFNDECPACSSNNSIWVTKNTNTGIRHKCKECNTTWRRTSYSDDWSVSSNTYSHIWTAFDGPLDLQTGTPEEFIKGNHKTREDHPEVTSAGCFIATAAFGTPQAKEIDELRRFRDDILLPNRIGERFVKLYYQFSPPIAGVIAKNKILQKATRSCIITPSLWFVKKYY